MKTLKGAPFRAALYSPGFSVFSVRISILFPAFVIFEILNEVADAVNAVPAQMMFDSFNIIVNLLFINTNDS